MHLICGRINMSLTHLNCYSVLALIWGFFIWGPLSPSKHGFLPRRYFLANLVLQEERGRKMGGLSLIRLRKGIQLRQQSVSTS